MSMTGDYKQSPTAKAAIDAALKKMNEGTRKTAAEMKADREAWKQKSMADVKSRNEKSASEALERDKSNLPSLEKRHAELSEIHSKGKNWQYADREQNLSDEERQARNVSGELSSLGNRISAVKRSTSSYAKGGKISLSDCGTSTASKGKNNSSW